MKRRPLLALGALSPLTSFLPAAHAGRYAALIERLTAEGFTVYADDHRGHGRTGMKQHGDKAKLGRLGPGGHRAAVAAVWQFTQLIRDENPGLPLILLGHGNGQLEGNVHIKAPDGTPMANAMLTLLHNFGCGDVGSFGDSSGEMALKA